MGVRFTGGAKRERKICHPAGAACQPNLGCRVDFFCRLAWPISGYFLKCIAMQKLLNSGHGSPGCFTLKDLSFCLTISFPNSKELILCETSAKVTPTHRPVLEVMHRALQPDLPPFDGSEVPGSTRATAEEGHRVA